jgi:purine-nucleoside phosphorylase
MIAEKFLDDLVQFNAVRGTVGYTGKFEGKPISIMASGMGLTSMGIYSYELFDQYGVENIIRTGSAGSYTEDCKLGDIVLAESAYSESTFAKSQNGYDKDVNYPSKKLVDALDSTAKELGIPLRRGPIHSSDVFYYEDRNSDYPTWKRLNETKGLLAVENESFALFHNASVFGKNAAAILTVSDSLVTHEALSAEDRQVLLDTMFKIAFRTGVELA